MSLNIILADDHSLVRVGARAVIESSGVGQVIAEAGSADELLAVLSTHPCHVLVTDYSMPHSQVPDGHAMITTIQRRHPRLPLLLLSACSNPAVVNLMLDSGVLGLIRKSDIHQDLPMAIRMAHRGQAYPSASFTRAAGMGLQPAPARHPTPREIETLRFVGRGLTTRQIAELHHRSDSTVSRQKTQAMNKLGLSSEAALFNYVRASGL